MGVIFVRLAFCIAILISGRVNASEFHEVSIIQLIANPELFDGQDVRVIGFLHLEFEGDAVYLHRDDFDRSVFKNSVALNLNGSQEKTWRKLNNRYVIIEARFSSTAKGHFDLHSGSLHNIARLVDWPVRRTVKKLLQR